MPEIYTKKERLMLVNQYMILARMCPHDSYIRGHYEKLQQIFQNGYTVLYSDADSTIDDELSELESNFVLNVMTMYRNLYYSYLNNEENQDEINEEDIYFPGFDLNDEVESRYYSFAEFLVEDYDRYKELKELIEAGKVELNSHGSGPSMQQLSRMAVRSQAIDGLRFEQNRTYYTNAEILDIIHTR